MEPGDIYPDWEAWEKDFDAIEAIMADYLQLQGTLAEGPQQILKASLMGDDLGKMAGKLFRYPLAEQRHQHGRQRDRRPGAARAHPLRQFGTAMAWFNPEMLEIPWETMELVAGRHARAGTLPLRDHRPLPPAGNMC